MTELTVVMEDDGSRNIDVEALEQSMKEKLRSDSPLSAKCCIFRVPELLRRHKPEAYAPDIVSIGPFHHRNSKLFATMKDVKQCRLSSLGHYCEGYPNHSHDDEILHILDLIRSAIVVPFNKFESSEQEEIAVPHATALLEAGIEFRRRSGVLLKRDFSFAK
ncbi:hypothetical protein ABKV19_011648 [Rosa sericea]